jgi:hypothetical protein
MWCDMHGVLLGGESSGEARDETGSHIAFLFAFSALTVLV